jgi:hypothetical protein
MAGSGAAAAAATGFGAAAGGLVDISGFARLGNNDMVMACSGEHTRVHG